MVTADDPAMAAKMAQEIIVATARPPTKGLVAARTTSIKRCAIAPLAMIEPARRNMGMDRSTLLSNAFHMSSTR